MHRIFAACLVAALVVASLVSCKKGDCTKGCTHLVDMAQKELAAQSMEPNVKKSMLDEADKTRQANIDACVKSCSAGDYDANCLEEAQSVEGAKGCKK